MSFSGLSGLTVEMPPGTPDAVTHAATSMAEPTNMNPGVVELAGGEDNNGNTMVTNSMIENAEFDPTLPPANDAATMVVDATMAPAPRPSASPRVASINDNARPANYGQAVPLPIPAQNLAGQTVQPRGTIRSPAVTARPDPRPEAVALPDRPVSSLCKMDWLASAPVMPTKRVSFDRPGLFFTSMSFHAVSVSERSIALMFDTRCAAPISIPSNPKPKEAISIRMEVDDAFYDVFHTGMVHQFGDLLVLVFLRAPEEEDEISDPFTPPGAIMTMEKRGVTEQDAQAAQQKQAQQQPKPGSTRLVPANDDTIGNDTMSRLTKRAVDSLVRKTNK